MVSPSSCSLHQLHDERDYSIVTQFRRPGRKSRIVHDFPIETLKKYSIYRQDDAAEMLGVASITLKRICRRRNYRWTYRAYKAQQRRDKLAFQKRRTGEALQRQRETPSSPSFRIPELLLSLGQERNKVVNCSPTSVSDVGIATPTQFPLTTESRTSDLVRPLLPPLSYFLKKHQSNCKSSFNQRRLLPSTDYKSSIYGASFFPTAPTFPTRGF
ncbi:hypothetical protein PPTG_15568 [Phytophthora nicotianae INRA-310]|uniref:RWP-RK domain-containing protein n=1 Tax=Phytophthora nicotianae (strain INRA-310) TaxID=761204 RepID=W2PU79_PHYN3|nr:hypothetical protein PPTG_15568 [Phytophthora nicotianae INRA-310]ETN03585.1 hypothetical protein PPTG_15568 [Phytophthora nicotianae INRA-310]